MHQAGCPQQIDGQDVLELFVGAVADGRARTHSGDVRENVHASKGDERLRDETVDVGAGRDIGGYHERRDATLLHLPCKGAEHFVIWSREDHHRASSGEGAYRRRPDAAGRAGDDRHPTTHEHMGPVLARGETALPCPPRPTERPAAGRSELVLLRSTGPRWYTPMVPLPGCPAAAARAGGELLPGPSVAGSFGSQDPASEGVMVLPTTCPHTAPAAAALRARGSTCRRPGPFASC